MIVKAISPTPAVVKTNAREPSLVAPFVLSVEGVAVLLLLDEGLLPDVEPLDPVAAAVDALPLAPVPVLAPEWANDVIVTGIKTMSDCDRVDVTAVVVI